MTSKFWFLAGMSFKKKVKTKWFLIANIILLVAIVGIMNVDSIITFFGGEFNDANQIVILDKTDYQVTEETFKNSVKNANKLFGIEDKNEFTTYEKSEEDLKKELKGTSKIAIIFDKTDKDYLTAKVISDEYINTSLYQSIVQALSLTKTEIAMSETNIDKEELNKITTPIQIERLLLNEDKNSEGENMEMVMGAVFPTVILPFFVLVILLVQMIGTEINEEKSTRSMEVIISNVSPKTHFFAKIVASNGFVLLQGGLLILYSAIALFVKQLAGASGSVSSFTSSISDVWESITASGIADKLYYIIPLTLVLLVLSFLAYSLVSGILASMTVNMEDFQQIQSPLLMISLVGYYLAIMAGMFDGSIIIRILSYVPFISCLLSPTLLMIGQVGIIDVVISVGILILFNFVVIKYGLKIYKIGILNYSTDKMWKRIFKAAKSNN